MNRYATDIAVTGAASVSAAGIGMDPLCDAVASGRNCMQPVPVDFGPSFTGQFWGKADRFRATEFIAPLKARKLDRASQFAVAVAGMALADSGIEKGSLTPERIGIALDRKSVV